MASSTLAFYNNSLIYYTGEVYFRYTIILGGRLWPEARGGLLRVPPHLSFPHLLGLYSDGVGEYPPDALRLCANRCRRQ